MAGLDEMIMIVIGLFVISVVAYLATGVSELVSLELPVNESGDFADVTTGADILDTNMGIVSIAILIIVISVAIKKIRGMNGSQ